MYLQTVPKVFHLLEVAQVTNSNNGEAASSTRIQVLAQIVIDVITTGTSALPAFERKGLGHIRFREL